MSHEDFTLPAVVEETAASKTVSNIPYSAGLAERITALYAEGMSLHKIAQKAEMPAYGTLIRWAKKHPELSKMLRAVRDARALHFEDKAIQSAEDATGKDADRLKFEAYKWGAEVNDPATYGKKVAHDVQGPGAQVVIQVVTGFGPPNPWQTPPKLNPDGTIDKSYENATPVASEVKNGKNPDQGLDGHGSHERTPHGSGAEKESP